MADNSTWEESLPQHAIFRNFEEKEENDLKEEEHRNILVERDGEIFIWDASKGQILTTNLKNFHFQNDRADRFQAFLCTSSPVFNVHSLSFSVTARYIAIIGDHGITVIEVPQRWGKFAEYENGKEKINCRTIKVDERFFSAHQSIKVVEVKWHPGSQTDSHLVVLTSDNKLRVINILKPEGPEQVIPLGVPFSSTAEYTKHSISSTSTFAAALGETSVGFDFAPSIADPTHSQGSRKSESDVIYPVFVLRENGDVYYLLLRLAKKGSSSELVGPLSMHPGAEDNYGLDACSITCLHSKPPVVVMATTSGQLYHCIVLESSDGEDSEEEGVDKWSNERSRMYHRTTRDLSLFVHECVELQSSLTTEEEEGSELDRIASPASDDTDNDNPLYISLHKDPVVTSQYHCCHSSGIHSITLPWVRKLEHFCATDQESGDAFNPDEAAIVYHMICTTPKPASHPAPVQGFAVVSDRLLGPSMLCITPSMECIVRSLNILRRSIAPPVDDEGDDDNKRTRLSPMKHVASGSFLDLVKNILTRNTSNPILRAGKTSSNMTQQELYEILVRAQQILRKEYIQKQNKAKEEIDKRSSMLEEQRNKQVEDLQKLEVEREACRCKASEMAEKLEEVQDQNERLLGRINGVFKDIQAGVPFLSDSEKKMKEELEKIQEYMKFMKSSLQEVKAKKNWSTQRSKRTKSDSLPVVNGTQQKSIRKILHQENDMIAELVSQVKNLKLQVGV